MKHCDRCGKDFDIPELLCPICGGELREAGETDEIAALMLLFGLL